MIDSEGRDWQGGMREEHWVSNCTQGEWDLNGSPFKFAS